MWKQKHYHNAAVTHLKSSYLPFLVYCPFFNLTWKVYIVVVLSNFHDLKVHEVHSVTCTVSKLHGHYQPERDCFLLLEMWIEGLRVWLLSPWHYRGFIQHRKHCQIHFSMNRCLSSITESTEAPNGSGSVYTLLVYIHGLWDNLIEPWRIESTPKSPQILSTLLLCFCIWLHYTGLCSYFIKAPFKWYTDIHLIILRQVKTAIHHIS